MKNRFLFLFICFLLSSFPLLAQEQTVSGKVIDSLTREPLAFVNITINNTFQGATADIDGKFTVHFKGQIEFLKFSYIGYESLTYAVYNQSRNLKIEMIKKKLELKEVEIFPGVNPAHRIIDSVFKNSNLNNPEKMHSFAYTSYNKMSFTADVGSDSIKKPDENDTNVVNVLKFMKNKYFFLMESINKRQFLHPDKNYEKIIASNVSGFKDPLLVLIMNSFQSFSFYNEWISLAGENYINPISSGSTSKYLFMIQDTTYSGKDTVFIISFRPFKSKNFDGLKGTMYINSNHWAVQNVMAEPYKKKGGIGIKIQQQYEYVSGKQWFPSQLNTDVTFNNASINGFHVIGTGRTYLRDIAIDPPLKNSQFSNIDVEIDPDAINMSDEFWNKYRKDSLTAKEKNTYVYIDSLSKELNLEKKMQGLRYLLSGKLPWGPIDIDLFSILNANEREGIRLGLGLSTNDKVSRVFSIGGYAAYGFSDEAFKYGGSFTCIVNKRHDVSFKLQYTKDISEAGSVSFFDDKMGLGSDFYRTVFQKLFDNIEQKTVSFQFKSLRYLTTHIDFSQYHKTPIYSYHYKDFISDTTFQTHPEFRFTEIRLCFRYAYNEKYIQNIGYKMQLETNYPILWIQLTRGFRGVLDGDFEFNRIDLKLEKSFYIKYLGKTSFQLLAGYTDSKLPYCNLFNGRGSNNDWYIYATRSYTTMGINEFAMNRYVSLFFTHNFGKLLFRSKGFEPEPALCGNVLFGDLGNMEKHFDLHISPKAPVLGYYEAGIMILNLYKSSLTSLGCGAFYRLGPYSHMTFDNNIALRWTLGVNL
ncbi:MAG: DUF5686 family protein [Bacteroidota bacterium]